MRRLVGSPVRPESDEEGEEDEAGQGEEKGADKKADGAADKKDAGTKAADKKDEKPPAPVRIDFEGIGQRIVALPIERDRPRPVFGLGEVDAPHGGRCCRELGHDARVDRCEPEGVAAIVGWYPQVFLLEHGRRHVALGVRHFLGRDHRILDRAEPP